MVPANMSPPSIRPKNANPARQVCLHHVFLDKIKVKILPYAMPQAQALVAYTLPYFEIIFQEVISIEGLFDSEKARLFNKILTFHLKLALPK